jgi:hypothetical protein
LSDKIKLPRKFIKITIETKRVPVRVRRSMFFAMPIPFSFVDVGDLEAHARSPPHPTPLPYQIFVLQVALISISK